MTRGIALNRNMGMVALGIWLILYGLSSLVALGLPPVVMAVLALVAGILILAGREGIVPGYSHEGFEPRTREPPDPGRG